MASDEDRAAINSALSDQATIQLLSTTGKKAQEVRENAKAERERRDAEAQQSQQTEEQSEEDKK